MRFYHATKNGKQFKIYELFMELFIPGIFYLIFSEHGLPQETETTDSRIAVKRGLEKYSIR